MTVSSAPPRTPAERRRAKKRETIINAAERMFAEHGEAGLSIRRLAEEINYSPASIYKYFDSKDALVDELKEAFFGRLHSRILEKVEQFQGEPHDALMRDCIVEYVQIALEQSHHYAAAFSAIGDPNACGGSPEDWEIFITTRKGAAFSFLVDSVERGQALGIFDPELDPALSAKSIWASCHGLAHLLLHMPDMRMYLPGGEQDTDGRVLQHHATMIVRGLMRPHASSHDTLTLTGRSK